MLTQLKDLGLSDNEARVYVAMLELGQGTVMQIASKAGINRPTTYVQIEALKKRGLVQTLTKGKKALLSAQDPSQLETMLEREVKEIEIKKSELTKILPELQTMWGLGGNKPRIRYFEGIQGLRDVQNEFLKTKSGVMYGIFNVDAFADVFPDGGRDYVRRRVQKGIRARTIYTSRKGKIIPEANPKELGEARYMDPTKFKFEADITIFDDNVALTSLQGTISCTVITHAGLAQSFRGLFEFLWAAAGSTNV